MLAVIVGYYLRLVQPIRLGIVRDNLVFVGVAVGSVLFVSGRSSDLISEEEDLLVCWGGCDYCSRYSGHALKDEAMRLSNFRQRIWFNSGRRNMRLAQPAANFWTSWLHISIITTKRENPEGLFIVTAI